MTATKRADLVLDTDTDNVMSSSASIPQEVRITIAIPGELTAIIDRLRKPTKTSRRTWLLQAAYEKLKRDGEI
jgi:hypothetical protein